jgi:hypothetical protein
MAGPSVTNTFSNSTTADATQVNTNFTDLINGATDGTKDYSINALTVAGAANLNGNVTLGNAAGDDITITGSLASSIPIKTTNSYDLGSSTLGLRSLYFGANSQTTKIIGSGSMSATWTLTLPVSAGSAGRPMVTDGSGVSSWAAPAAYTGYLTNSTNNWTTASATFADPTTSGGTNTVTDIVNSNMGTAAIAGSSVAGITLTLPYTGIYLVSVQVNIFANTAGNYRVRLVDGSGTVIATGLEWSTISGVPVTPTTLTGIYSGTAGSTTFKVQGSTSSGTFTISERASTCPAMLFSVHLIR